MSRMGILCAALAVGTLIGWSGNAVAQRPYSNSSYRPRRPTLSPYLQLFRTDPGQILPSYQNFVQPRIETRDFRQQQERDVQNLQSGLNQVQHAGQLQHTSGTIQSGIGSTFQTHSQYFRSHSSNFRTHRTQAPGGAARRGR
jgi:membrane-anchored protein YejM (alkaline phosphatase superfamily)